MRLGAARWPLLVVLLGLSGCPLGIETGYKVEDSAGGSSSASAGVGGTLPISGNGGGGGSIEGGAANGGTSGGDSGGSAGVSGSAGSSGSGGSVGSGGEAGMETGGNGGSGGSSGDGGSGGNGGTGGAPTCEQTCADTCCDEACIDTTTSNDNCGACGTQCPLGRTCSDGKCAGGWLTEATIPTVTARSRAAQAWTGTKLFVWGGQNSAGTPLNSGFLYDPLTGDVTIVNTTGAPSARIFANAIWLPTTEQILVFGGSNTAVTATYYSSGALYDVGLNIWEPVSDAPQPRRSAVGVWTGSKALFYGGGTTGGGAPSDLVMFTPGNVNPWTTASQTNEADPRGHFAWGWSGTQLFLCCGTDGSAVGTPYRDSAFRYTVSNNTWEMLDNGKGEEYGVFGAWNGTGFFTFGGRSALGLVSTGSIFTSAWAATSNTGVPTARYAPHRESGWSVNIAPGKVLVLGGRTNTVNPATYAQNGGIHTAGGNPQWTSVPAWSSGEAHAFGVGQWTGQEFLLWGGLNGTTPTSTLDRWAP